MSALQAAVTVIAYLIAVLFGVLVARGLYALRRMRRGDGDA